MGGPQEGDCFIEEDDLKTAQNIVGLTVDATIGETTCLEEVLKMLFQQEKISNKVVKLWMLIALNRDTMTVPISIDAKVRPPFLIILI